MDSSALLFRLARCATGNEDPPTGMLRRVVVAARSDLQKMLRHLKLCMHKFIDEDGKLKTIEIRLGIVNAVKCFPKEERECDEKDSEMMPVLPTVQETLKCVKFAIRYVVFVDNIKSNAKKTRTY
ncbi:Protein of unknown function [Gryllus bimaculatus]|nr:Protein of unknown function [Gryllus bimaculatus]